MALSRFALTDLLTCTRASAGLVRNASGVYSSVGNNVLRRSFEGGSFCLLAEETRTNRAPNNSMTGAVVGVIGAGGALPTGWTISNIASASVEILSIAPKNGLPNIRVRFNGTPTGSVSLIIVAPSAAPAAAENQTWAASMFCQRVGGSIDNITALRIAMNTFDGGNAFVGNRNGPDFKDTIDNDARLVNVNALPGAATTKVNCFVSIGWTSGAIDITLDISAPQLELGAFATSPILTTAGAATRNADQIKLNDGLLAQIYGGGPVSVLSEFEMEYVTSGAAFPALWHMDDGTSGNRFIAFVNEPQNGFSVSLQVNSTTPFDRTEAYTSGALMKLATRFQAGANAMSRNGAAVFTNANAGFPSGLINLGISNAGATTTSNPARLLRLRKLIVYPHALTNAELEALSA